MVQEIILTGAGIAVGFCIAKAIDSFGGEKSTGIPKEETSLDIPKRFTATYQVPEPQPQEPEVRSSNAVITDEETDRIINLPPGVKLTVEPKFQIGDIVQLNSGGPCVTVDNCAHGLLSATGYVTEGENKDWRLVEVESMPQDAFTLIKSKSE